MWAFFTREEFKCKGTNCCGGSNLIENDFISKLDQLRRSIGVPLVVNSGYRCPVHNQRVSTTGANGPHTTGRAVDLKTSGAIALEVLEVALASGHFTGVGVKQHGAHDGRFLHLDDLRSPHPRPNIWTY